MCYQNQPLNIDYLRKILSIVVTFYPFLFLSLVVPPFPLLFLIYVSALEIMKKIIVITVGNIGAGKSLFLTRLGARGFETIKEPIEDWEDLLNRETNERGRDYIPHIQTRITTSLIKRERKMREILQRSQVIIAERDIECATNIFIPTAKEMGFLDEEGDYTLQELCNSLTRLRNLEEEKWQEENGTEITRKILYIKTDPQTCLNRIRRRNHPGDAMIKLDYLEKIDQKHTDWLKSRHQKVVTINNGQNDNTKIEEIIDMIQKDLFQN